LYPREAPVAYNNLAELYSKNPARIGANADTPWAFEVGASVFGEGTGISVGASNVA